jgi:tetratricopeptide (TPR) repeat protein
MLLRITATRYDLVTHKRPARASSRKHYREAIEELSLAIAADPTFALAYNARGFAYYLLREYPRALADFDKAIELNPGYKNALDNREAARRATGLKER